jgi:hypothetical protein
MGLHKLTAALRERARCMAAGWARQHAAERGCTKGLEGSTLTGRGSKGSTPRRKPARRPTLVRSVAISRCMRLCCTFSTTCHTAAEQSKRSHGRSDGRSQQGRAGPQGERNLWQWLRHAEPRCSGGPR